MPSTRAVTTALNLIVAAGVAAASLLGTLTAERPAAEGGWVAHSEVEAAMAHHGKTVNRPAWKASYARRFVRCTATQPEGIASAVVAVDLDGRVAKVPTAEAWERQARGDFWVVGFCA